ncbi:MAG: response regulator [Clostridiales bacterium]|jgi:DNA-binding response OmpR family regulator|nr:response regulator [Clostridiales bacterium]
MAHKIVLVDPSPSVQKVVRMAFAAPDFDVYAFEDGVEAASLLGEIDPDAVLLSLSLPLKDGYDVGRDLAGREDLKKIGLVFLKNAFEPVDADKIRGLEYDAIVQKPFDSKRLALLVRDVIDKKRGPHSFPEESMIEEIPPTALLPPSEDPDMPLASLDEDVEEKIKAVVREEILAVERELEKRLRASLLAELKGWLDKGGKPSP